jgi:hypothetical protein
MAATGGARRWAWRCSLAAAVLRSRASCRAARELAPGAIASVGWDSQAHRASLPTGDQVVTVSLTRAPTARSFATLLWSLERFAARPERTRGGLRAARRGRRAGPRRGAPGGLRAGASRGHSGGVSPHRRHGVDVVRLRRRRSGGGRPGGGACGSRGSVRRGTSWARRCGRWAFAPTSCASATGRAHPSSSRGGRRRRPPGRKKVNSLTTGSAGW